MKFIQYIKKDRYFALRLECDEENDDSDALYGYRAEAPYPRLALHNYEVLFDYLPKKPLHPDLLALLCLVIYYPFFQKWTDTLFPSRISSEMAKALAELPLYTWDGDRNNYCRVEGGGITVPSSGIDIELSLYKGNGTTLLSFGGGLDSTAVKCLFPGAHIVHEKEWRFHKKGPKKSRESGGQSGGQSRERTIGVEDLIATMDRRPGSSSHSYVIASNNRNLTKPTGWTGWISCIATSLLVANDSGASNILLGSSLASLLGGGKRFIGVKGKDFPGTHIWSVLLWRTVGISLFCPAAGLSEIALVRIIKNTSQAYLKKCTWCFRKGGYPCHTCFKCLRRDLLVFSEDDKNKHELFPWERYRHAKIPSLDRIGPTMYYLLHRYLRLRRGDLPSWIALSYTKKIEGENDEPHLSEATDLNPSLESFEQEWSWLRAWYLPSLCLVPEHLRTYVYKRIAQKVRPMTDSEKVRLESFDSTFSVKKDSSPKIKDE